jgi:hypothetical protein
VHALCAHERKTDIDETRSAIWKEKESVYIFSVCSLSGLFSEKKRDRDAPSRMNALLFFPYPPFAALYILAGLIQYFTFPRRHFIQIKTKSFDKQFRMEPVLQ